MKLAVFVACLLFALQLEVQAQAAAAGPAEREQFLVICSEDMDFKQSYEVMSQAEYLAARAKNQGQPELLRRARLAAQNEWIKVEREKVEAAREAQMKALVTAGQNAPQQTSSRDGVKWPKRKPFPSLPVNMSPTLRLVATLDTQQEADAEVARQTLLLKRREAPSGLETTAPVVLESKGPPRKLASPAASQTRQTDAEDPERAADVERALTLFHEQLARLEKEAETTKGLAKPCLPDTEKEPVHLPVQEVGHGLDSKHLK